MERKKGKVKGSLLARRGFGDGLGVGIPLMGKQKKN